MRRRPPPTFTTAIVTLNLLAPLWVIRAANQVMQGQDGGGAIVTLGPLDGLAASPGTAAYGAAKAGLVHLTQSLAVEWAPAVRVNCVSAGHLAPEAVDLPTGGGPAAVPWGAGARLTTWPRPSSTWRRPPPPT